MAPLTWREVSAPNFSGVAQSQQLAAQLLNNGFGALSDALGKFQGHSQNRADSAAMAEALRFTDSSSLGDALRSGSILSNPSNLSAGALKYIGGRQRDLINNQTNQFDLDRRQTLHNQAQDVLASQPALAKVMADARNLAINGDAAGAQALLTQNTDLLTQGGFTADQIPQLLSGEFAASERGDEHRRHQLGEQKFWENQGISKQAQDIAHSAVNNNASFEQAFRNIQNNRDITDPRIKTQALEMLSKAAEAGAFPQADPAQQLLANLGMRSGGTASALLRQFEGYRDTPYWDVNAHRVGYGSDTVTRPDGSVVRVTPGMQINREDAERDLERRINSEFVPGIIQTVGADNWSRLPEPAQAALTSVAYNYGSLPNRVAQAVSTGNIEAIAEAVESLQGHNNGVNAERRREEAAIIRGQRGTPSGEAGPAVQGSSQEALSLLAPRINRAVGEDPAAELASSVLVAQTEDDVLAAEAAMNSPDFVGPAETRETEEDTSEAPSAGRRFLDGFLSVMGAGPANAEPTTNAQNVDAALSAATGKGDRLTPANVGQDTPPPISIQQARDTSTFDQALNRNAFLIDAVMNPPLEKETIDQVAKRMTGEGGPLPSGNHQAVMAAIQETIDMAGGNLAPHLAGAIVANNTGSRDTTGWQSMLFGINDPYLTKDENPRSATRTNMEAVKKDLNDLGLFQSGAVDLSKAPGLMDNLRRSEAAGQDLASIQTAMQSAQSTAAQALMAIQSGQDTPENRAALQQALQMIQQLEMYAQQIAGGPNNATTIYSRSLPGLPTQ